ncbi:MAG: DNA replication/repair protein RecF [Alphaproteobacteria bacterium]|nr:DNA replication/repair protein RecF [Alphaproteobacteria bacterium]
MAKPPRMKTNAEADMALAVNGASATSGINLAGRVTSLQKLTLTNFRNYSHVTLSLSPQPVVLTGANGAGKTNILEAVSLLTPGRGLRRARVIDIDRASPHSANPLPVPWAVAAVLQQPDGDLTEVATGRDAEAALTGADRRRVRIEGNDVPQSALADILSVIWLTPQLDQLFQEGQSARRKFLDRLVYSFESDHAQHVAAYEQAMRERNQLLQERCNDAKWFAALEKKMAEHAVVVAAYRLQTIERLNIVIAQSQRGFPKATLELHGVVEDLLQSGCVAMEAESRFAEQLHQCRQADSYAGRTSEGIHRTEWLVFHQEKNMEAGQCSTGEQKAVMLSIVLAQARARAMWGVCAPILLLDEVVAHLDLKRRAELAEEILDIGVQAWLTGTDAEGFGDLAAKAQFFNVSDAIVRLQN